MQELRHEATNGNTIAYTQYVLPRLGGQFLLVDPPANSEPLRSIVLGLRNDLVRLEESAETFRGDTSLSDAGRAAKLAPLREALAKRVESAQLAVNIDAQRNASDTAAFYAPPKLEPGDVVSFSFDKEIRDTYGSMSPEQFQRSIASLDKGDRDRTIVALARSPIPGVAREFARAALREELTASKPAKAAQLTADGEMVDWAASTAKQISNLLRASRRPIAQAA